MKKIFLILILILSSCEKESIILEKDKIELLQNLNKIDSLNNKQKPQVTKKKKKKRRRILERWQSGRMRQS